MMAPSKLKVKTHEFFLSKWQVNNNMFGFFKKEVEVEVVTVITDSFAPKQEVHTQQGVMKYLKDISRLSYENLCIEFSNVMAAKHNLTMVPSGINNAAENQRIVTDLVDKAFLICICKFGQERVSNFAKNDLTRVNKLIIQCDQEVAAHPVLPHEHGLRLFNKLEQYF